MPKLLKLLKPKEKAKKKPVIPEWGEYDNLNAEEKRFSEGQDDIFKKLMLNRIKEAEIERKRSREAHAYLYAKDLLEREIDSKQSIRKLNDEKREYLAIIEAIEKVGETMSDIKSAEKALANNESYNYQSGPKLEEFIKNKKDWLHSYKGMDYDKWVKKLATASHFPSKELRDISIKDLKHDFKMRKTWYPEAAEIVLQ